MNPQEPKQVLSSRLRSFPVTDFDDQGGFRPASDNHAERKRMPDACFLPCLEIRRRKAGARLVGHDGGPVRAPLTDLTAQAHGMLHELILAQGAR